jgi:hypothetical protein
MFIIQSILYKSLYYSSSRPKYRDYNYSESRAYINVLSRESPVGEEQPKMNQIAIIR